MKKVLATILVVFYVLFNAQSRPLRSVMNLEHNSIPGSRTGARFNVSPDTKLDADFWVKVQSALQSGPVDVVFAAGEYPVTATININAVGHPANLLSLKTAAMPGSAVITGSIANLVKFIDCSNILLWGLKFTGDVSGYAVTFTNSRNITVDNCYFVDLHNVFYGALGVHSKSDNAVVKNCTFARVGQDSHAHMIYGAYDVTRLKIVNNSFTDCAGAFVRFRGNLSTHGVVYGNEFTSTGTYRDGANPVFIEVPVFNDVNPGDERFGTSFMVAKNRFTYSTLGKQTTRFAMVFHHSGFNPPDRVHLITPEDALVLNNGTVEQKRALLLAKPGIDASQVRFAENTTSNVALNVVYRCQGGYGAVAPFQGIADIESATTTGGVATSVKEALAFYDDLY